MCIYISSSSKIGTSLNSADDENFRNGYVRFEVCKSRELPWCGTDPLLLSSLSSYHRLPTAFNSVLSQADWTEFWSELCGALRDCCFAARLFNAACCLYQIFVIIFFVMTMYVDNLPEPARYSNPSTHCILSHCHSPLAA